MTITTVDALAAVTPFASGPAICLTQPTEQDLCIYRGDTGRLKLTVSSGGAPLNVSTATWDADIRATEDDATVLASFTVTPVGGDTASVYIDLPAAASAQLDGDALYDVQMTLAGTVQTLLRGKITVTKDVSRSP
jgi:hypothetical protein